ncbi:hypothetical protein O181_047953 [Austropuccinia psidii MF-1]|uniref:Endonuclease/exonuclease/phosphatase domain-containing protein n=1 Tax=Austropuccinia psidii MF-1 TaxID=1389203 RepID=A0A9Q3HK11_9BASI|nr:hypothetical protein [Austropuccinia psidii MF-1]
MVSENPHPTTNSVTPTSSSKPDHTTSDPLLNFTFLQLNCHNRYDSTMSVLNTELTHMALLLQEHWTNPCNGHLATHPNWHRSIPTHQIHSTPRNNNLTTDVTINNLHPTIPRLTLLSVYNTPTKFDGLPHLQTWLTNLSSRNTPTLIMMDSNLHHRLWNPPQYQHSHPESPTAHDVWEERLHTHLPQTHPNLPRCRRATHNNQPHVGQPHSPMPNPNHLNQSHQPIVTKIHPLNHTPKQRPNKLLIALRKLDHKKFITSLHNKLEADSATPLDPDTCTINQSTTTLTEAIRKAFEVQGEWVNTNYNHMKPWWNTEILNPLAKKSNAARCQMLKTGSSESRALYYQHQETFKKKVWELKTNNWRKFLAEKGPEHAYLAYKFTKEQLTNEICPLKSPEGHLITEVKEKATMLFNGMSLIPTATDLYDIPTSHPTPDSPHFPPVTEHEISRAISKLPNKKAVEPDNIQNELLKIAKDTITPHLSIIFNTSLMTHHFPPQWKEALTTIIRKTTQIPTHIGP